MSEVHDGTGDAERERLRALLDAAAGQSQRIAFWWRDDDAMTVTPELDRLLALAGRHALPLGLAVIPQAATEALAARIAHEPRVRVLQHGWQHKRHSPQTEKKMELGDHRPVAEMLAELRTGLERLASLFPAAFLPVLVPPWNRIGETVNAERGSIGLAGLSMFGPKRCGDPHQVNTHVDIIDWGARAPMPRGQVYALLCREVERRLQGDPEPIGILSHHLIHQEASWGILDEILGLLREHPGVEWPAIDSLFALTSRATGGLRAGTHRRSHA